MEVRGADARARLAFTACSEVPAFGAGFAAGLDAGAVFMADCGFSPLGLLTVPAGLTAAIVLVCVARFFPEAVASRPPRAVAPVLENLPLLSRA